MAISAQGGYTNLTNATSSGAKTEIKAQIDKFMALFSTQANGQPAASPDFNQVPPAILEKIQVEITALKACITAGA